MTDDMIEDVFPEADSPHDVQWVSDSADEPTFPEGAWTDKTALVETALEGQKYQVKFEGVYWTATTLPPGAQLTLGDMVAVLGRDGTELVVQQRSDRQTSANPPHNLVDPSIDPSGDLSGDPSGQAPLSDTLI
ncbi:MAG TPA: NfeD family protein [Nodosilinea sp.]|jgi:hypothetical protein|nr:NfeD family protein [Nodosilinea sp.]